LQEIKVHTREPYLVLEINQENIPSPLVSSYTPSHLIISPQLYTYTQSNVMNAETPKHIPVIKTPDHIA